MTDASAGGYLHANAVALGEKGLLLRGRSGAGKSSLTLALIARFAAQGDFARLVGDDRVHVTKRCDRLVARPHPAIAGLIEVRGLGPVPTPFEPACVLHAVVDIAPPGEAPERFPEAARRTVRLMEIELPHLAVRSCDDVSLAKIAVFIQSVNSV
jgi:serine kinase of HPr protein (carbohydrate metabolism regulator)